MQLRRRSRAVRAAVGLRVLRAGVYRGRFLASLPTVAAGAVARAWGEALGCFAGRAGRNPSAAGTGAADL